MTDPSHARRQRARERALTRLSRLASQDYAALRAKLETGGDRATVKRAARRAKVRLAARHPAAFEVLYQEELRNENEEEEEEAT